ncbi:MAG: patatin-like phospholipase family protein [Spirosomataceae bacterium]|jgi:NTE family protein
MKIGLTLSGGGSRGFAHLGVLKALEEFGIKPDHISGSSAGALVGALYCSGLEPEEIGKIIKKKGISGGIKLAFNKLGLFSIEKVEKILMEFIPLNTFESLKTSLTICTTDIQNGEAVYFNSGELSKPVLASCAIPGIFSPVIIDNKTLVDGGVINNLPIEPIENLVDFKIGVNLMPDEKNMPVATAKDILMKCLILTLGKQAEQKYPKFDILIEPEKISSFDGLSLKKSEEMFELGYMAAKNAIKKSGLNNGF